MRAFPRLIPRPIRRVAKRASIVSRRPDGTFHTDSHRGERRILWAQRSQQVCTNSSEACSRLTGLKERTKSTWTPRPAHNRAMTFRDKRNNGSGNSDCFVDCVGRARKLRHPAPFSPSVSGGARAVPGADEGECKFPRARKLGLLQQLHDRAQPDPAAGPRQKPLRTGSRDD